EKGETKTYPPILELVKDWPIRARFEAKVTKVDKNEIPVVDLGDAAGFGEVAGDFIEKKVPIVGTIVEGGIKVVAHGVDIIIPDISLLNTPGTNCVGQGNPKFIGSDGGIYAKGFVNCNPAYHRFNNVGSIDKSSWYQQVKAGVPTPLKYGVKFYTPSWNDMVSENQKRNLNFLRTFGNHAFSCGEKNYAVTCISDERIPTDPAKPSVYKIDTINNNTQSLLNSTSMKTDQKCKIHSTDYLAGNVWITSFDKPTSSSSLIGIKYGTDSDVFGHDVVTIKDGSIINAQCDKPGCIIPENSTFSGLKGCGLVQKLFDNTNPHPICDSNAVTIGKKDIYATFDGTKKVVGTVELRYSSACQTKWARVICSDCKTSSTVIAKIVRNNDAKEYSKILLPFINSEWKNEQSKTFWSPMVYAPDGCNAYVEGIISSGIIASEVAVAKQDECSATCSTGIKRGTRSDTECLEEQTPTISASCDIGLVSDCNQKCVSALEVTQKKGDGHCDNGEQGINLKCSAFNNDGGDCDISTTSSSTVTPGTKPTPGASCGSGSVYDCIYHCVDASEAAKGQGDGYCDDGRYGMVLTCSAFNNDGGDCNTSTKPIPEPEEPVEPPYPPTEITSVNSDSPYATTKNVFNAGNGTWYAYGRVLELVAWGYLSEEVGTRMRDAFAIDKSGRHSKNWPSPDFLGGNWFATSSTTSLPTEKRQRGLLAVWSNGEYGHVGFVEEVNTDKTQYRLSSFNLLDDGKYRNQWYDFEGTGPLPGYYPQFYNLTKPNW
ncbi:CHAP domain-containing protein, partial [Candidatus Parabeggiatoa sp. HSG14]|uniref:CHAP domain-containing protein n=1 Tax=Candidatus Parabeggiatoa sp. HSG14 TaxID=3055593 RepID=UPI0025A8CA15|nr:DUF2690 domain-containing protein [Thiotrichales bacterium HSG14]